MARFFINQRAQRLAWTFVKEHWSALEPKVTIFGGDTNLIRSMGAWAEGNPGAVPINRPTPPLPSSCEISMNVFGSAMN